MTNASNRSALFIASCASLLVTSLSFGIRAGILGDLGVEFQLNTSELSRIAATAFWGFPVSMIIGGKSITLKGLEARIGIEPMSTDLQKLAVLLRYCIY